MVPYIVRSLSYVLGVAPKLRLAQKYAFIKKIHIFFPIIMEFGQNNIHLSK